MLCYIVRLDYGTIGGLQRVRERFEPYLYLNSFHFLEMDSFMTSLL